LDREGSTVRLRLLVLLVALGLTASLSEATTISSLDATHRYGQTFVTWAAPPGTGWTFRIYSSAAPIATTADLGAAELLGAVGDSSACDHRLSSLLGVTYGFHVDSAGVELQPDAGLFVATPPVAGPRWYAVTAQAVGAGEDRTIVAGANALASAIHESPAPPRPVWQREIDSGGSAAQDYVLWTTNRATPYFPAMTTAPCWPTHTALVRGAPAPNNILFLRGHGRGLNFLTALIGNSPSDWRLAFDDFLPNKDVASFYFGYNEDYILQSDANPPPLSGVVHDYTHQRILYMLDWCLANYPVDPQRIYAFGHSMGGSFGVFLALCAGDRVAAVWSNTPKLDLSDFRGSVLTESMFSPMWGEASTDLPTDSGMPVYERLRAASLAYTYRTRETAPILSFAGRGDEIVGWPEKVDFYSAVEAAHLGGVHFWDQRAHVGSGGMDPMGSLTELFRYRLDRSWPAFSRCSADQDPGNGDPAVGDSIGTLHGYVDWDTSLVDYADRWEVVLRGRDLQTRSGILRAPDSFTVDVTPRRLQNFKILRGRLYAYEVKRLTTLGLVRAGYVVSDAYGRVTVPSVRVYKDGVRLRLKTPGPADVADLRGGQRPMLALDRSPLTGRGTFTVAWPGSGAASLAVFDVSGRRIRTLVSGPVFGESQVTIDARTFSPGVYFARAEQGGNDASVRFVVLN
jgi:hypothetical protein